VLEYVGDVRGFSPNVRETGPFLGGRVVFWFGCLGGWALWGLIGEELFLRMLWMVLSSC
jgi:hypothetical protein